MDGESLHDYESNSLRSVNISDVSRRLIAMERVEEGTLKTDSYFEGMGNLELKGYCSISDLMSVLPRQIACDCLITVNGTLFVREEKFEEWNLIKSKLSPLWIIAGALSKELISDDLKNRQAWLKYKVGATRQFKYTALLSPYIPDLDYFVRKTGGLNDLHIHLNGSTESDVIWNYMLSSPYQISSDYNKSFYSNSKLRKHAEQVACGFSPEQLLKRLLKARELRGKMINFLYDVYPALDEIDWGLESELLLYVLLIKYISCHMNENLARMLHYYLLIKGQIQSFVVMQYNQIGFSQFQLITDNIFRHRQELYYKKRFLQLASGCGKSVIRLIEGRFSPQKTVEENYELVKRIINGFNKAKKESKDLFYDTRLVLIAHFIKRQEKESEKEHFIKNYYLRKDLKSKAVSLMMLINKHPQLGKHVRGVDAAASEFDARPEVFAPTFSFLRKSGITHFTYHVGEDFCHLISGFRAIYEAVIFLQLQSGDRLGHCTALGIPPDLWMAKNQNYCYISRGEWLDDLVFIWYLVKQGLLELSQSVMFRVESRITELAQYIYGDVYLPHELSEVWLLRKCVPDESLNSYYPKYSYEFFQDNKMINKYMITQGQSRITKLWIKYHEGLRYSRDADGNRMPIGCRMNYDESIRIKSNEILDVEELKCVQTVLLEQLSEKNIIIEALPSSNMRISWYDSLESYHLKHWLNDSINERLLPTVVLGSDDPGIFMTNIYNEYALAYLHLKLNKYAPAKRLDKIRYIHEQSEIYSFDDGQR